MRTPVRFVALKALFVVVFNLGVCSAAFASSIVVPLGHPQAGTLDTGKGSLGFRRLVPEGAIGRVVIIPTAGETESAYDELASKFARAGLAVWTMDARGRMPEGQALSEKTSPSLVNATSFESIVGDLALLIEEEVKAAPGRPVSLIGEGSGGIIAGLYAERNPEKVAHLALVAPLFELNFGVRGSAGNFAFLSGQVLLGKSLQPAPGSSLGLGAWETPIEKNLLTSSETRRAGMVRLLKKTPGASSAGVTMLWARALADAAYRMSTDASKLRLPVLSLRGAQDTLTGAVSQDEFCVRLLMCTKITVPGARHRLLFEKDAAREATFAHLLRFFDLRTVSRAEGIAQATREKAL